MVGGASVNYLIKTSQPTAEPITLAEAQLHLRLDTYGSPPAHPDDALVSALITTARESAETYTGLTLVLSEYQAKAEPVNDGLSLQTWPVTSISSVTYQDEDDVTQTVDPADYYVDQYKRPAVLRFKKNNPGRVLTVTFTAGFTDGQSPNDYPMPKPIYTAMLLMIGHLYENREAVNIGNIVSEYPLAYFHLMTQYRVNMGL